MNLSFSNFVSTVKKIEKIYHSTEYLDDAIEQIITENINLEMVTTGDVAGVSLPIMQMKRRQPTYLVLSAEGQEFIRNNKDKFKKLYGDEWEEAINCIAAIAFG